MDDFKHIIRIANTDLNGNKKLVDALRKIKGVSFMVAHAICVTTAIDENKKTGTVSDTEARKIEEVFKYPQKFGIPEWLLNRRKDYDDGDNKHLISSELTFVVENDIRRQKKIKSYKGWRHMLGQPVRGQRTKSNFRVNKRKGPLGVLKSKTAKAQAASSEKKK